jgi:hypothetical protein
MNPALNPYVPGAGTYPPELSGRNDVLEKASVAVARAKNGLASQGLMLVGLRGVGKTVLLNAIRENAEAAGAVAPLVETPEGRSLPALLIPALQEALTKLGHMSAAGEWTRRAMRTLGSFVKAMKLSYKDIEFGLDLGTEPGSADSGSLEHDMGALFEAVGHAAKERKTMLLLCMDELQYVKESELGVLLAVLHRCNQRRLPVVFVGAGLPQLVGQMGKAKSYAERMFEFPEIGALPESAAREAVEKPARAQKVAFNENALKEILAATQGYPYFLQEWAKQSWNAAKHSPVTLADVRAAGEIARLRLDASFFRVRFDRLTPQEKRYLRAMAELGAGPHRTGDVAEKMARTAQHLGPVRASLIKKGMIYSPGHGDTAFTVPLFDGFMKRVMPEWEG